ncbi:IPT/TIG domain-containing protein [Embleya scabrispora]|uniref:IPT/TIG domain-containing protein n=1 Tax=Embleya scabrispora TaxID=159449 RepID=UPI000593E2A9|nr:IPT/TIG domain-containing protein [Embleya scabrispora]MYS86449.1 lipase [Streptomyces sp. SID5474]
MATPTAPQVCMTLSALAATAATRRPSGETRDEQTWRVAAGISQQLRALWPATRAGWHLAWLALSPDDANMAYITKSIDGSNRFAVVARGTIGNITDILEDLDVGTVVPFTASGSPTPVTVSKGAMTAFTQVATMVSIPPPPGDVLGAPVPEGAFAHQGATLAQALADLVEAAPTTPQPTVYVTGHSLGGSIATMLAPYLYTQARNWTNVPQFALETFAAPTAGLQSFATYVDGLPFDNNHHVNAWDAVPLAWSSLAEVKQDKWYPSPGPAGDTTVHRLFDVLDGLRKGNVYVQPGVRQQLPVDGDYSTHDPALTNSTLADFMGQVAYQHADNTYLGLLGTSLLSPSGPMVTSVSPTSGKNGSTVVIEGGGFARGSLLDFGPIPCTDLIIEPGGNLIRATVPDGVGIVDVRVTNVLGTSPVVPLGQFAYDGPAPLVVTGVDPTSGQAKKTTVTITGSGFPRGAGVNFKDQASKSVTWLSDTQLTATAPLQIDDDQTVDITVTVGDIASPTGPSDEFTYTGRL